MAFPRLNALSYWLYLGGSITMMSGFLVAGGAASFGWVAYAPLSNATNSPGAGADLWLMALALTGFSAIFTGVNLCATIFYLRAPGMTMFRVPIFSWNMLVTGDPDPHRLPRAVRGGGAALLRPALRHAHLHRPGRWCARAVAEPLLVLRPPRGVHPGLALLRDGHRHHPGVLPQAAVRLQGHGLRHHVHRRPVHRGVGPPHVHHRRGAAAVLLAAVLPDRRAHRHQVLQLDRDHVGWPAQLPDAHAVLASGSCSPS